MSQTKAQLIDNLVQPITGALGSASAPTFSFTTDPNTGLYSPGADQVAISTNGAGRLFVDASGNVGVGSNAPLSAAGYTSLRLNGSTGGLIELTSAATRVLQIQSLGAAAGAQITTIDNGSSPPLIFGTNSVERLRITSAGLVGIGTSAPQVLTHLSTSTDTQLRVESTSASGTNEAALQLIRGSNQSAIKNKAGGIEFFVQGLTNEVARIDSSGRLLLGTSSTSANTRLVVQGSSLGSGSPALQHLCFDGATPASGDGLGFLIFGDNSQSQGAWITARRDGGTWSGSSKPSRLEFSTTADGASSPTERMRIRSSGEVLVNSTALLDLNGQAFQVNGWSMFYQATTGTTASAFTHIQSGTQTVCLFRQGNPATTVGSISVSGGTTTTYNTSSDYRLKENVVEISDGIDRLLQLKPSRFNFISNPGKTVDGFIAHEVQDIVPEAITGDKDAVDDDGNPVYQGIDQSKLVPLLTAALQEAVTRIKTLEAKVAALEGA